MSLISYQKIKEELTNKQKLIAVSKGQDISKIKKLYELGHRDFGENYLQELIKKSSILPSDIHWHFLGKIQTNKIKNIIKFSSLIHSVSRKKVYQKILNTDVKKKCNFLLQLKLGNEDSKDGLSPEELIDIVENPPLLKYLNLALEQYSEDRKRVFNTRGKSFKSTNIDIDNEGESGTGKNLPPYYALAYIMKS